MKQNKQKIDIVDFKCENYCSNVIRKYLHVRIIHNWQWEAEADTFKEHYAFYLIEF